MSEKKQTDNSSKQLGRVCSCGCTFMEPGSFNSHKCLYHEPPVRNVDSAEEQRHQELMGILQMIKKQGEEILNVLRDMRMTQMATWIEHMADDLNETSVSADTPLGKQLMEQWMSEAEDRAQEEYGEKPEGRLGTLG